MGQEDVQEIEKLQKIRKAVVAVAIVLLVLSLVSRNLIFVYPRVLLWGAAGVISILEATKLKKLGIQPGNAWLNAAIYFAVAFLPLLRLR